MTVNKAILIGRLGADPDIRTTQSGNVVANLCLATSERRKSGDTWEEHTEWHSVTVFGKTAENVQRYCTKGKQLYIEGRIQTRKWQDKDGTDRWSTEIVANLVQFLGGKDDAGSAGGSGGGGYGGGSRGSSTKATDYGGNSNDNGGVDGSDIPF